MKQPAGGNLRAGLRIGLDAHYVDGFSQGVKTVLARTLEEFGKADGASEFFVYHKNTPSASEPQVENSSKIHHRKLLTNAGAFNQAFGFPYLAIRDKLDVFHSQYIAPFISPCPVVVTIHDILFESMPEFFGARHSSLLKLLVPMAARSSAHIITVSHYTREEIVKRYNIPCEKVSVIPNGVDARWRPLDPANVSAALDRLGVSKPYILNVGRIAPIKNVSGLLRAYQSACSEGIDLDLVIVGGKDQLFRESESARVLASFGKYAARVKFLGDVSNEDLVRIYNGAELFVFPSFGEGFGLPVLEAMACGTPVLCSNTTSLPEVAGSDGATFNPYDQEEFNGKLTTLLLNEEERLRLAKAGLERSRTFSWERSALETIRVYERIASR